MLSKRSSNSKSRHIHLKNCLWWGELNFFTLCMALVLSRYAVCGLAKKHPAIFSFFSSYDTAVDFLNLPSVSNLAITSIHINFCFFTKFSNSTI